MNIYTSVPLLEAQSLEETVLTEKAHSSEHDVEPEKKMATHHIVRHSSKQNLLRVHKQVCIYLSSVTFKTFNYASASWEQSVYDLLTVVTILL